MTIRKVSGATSGLVTKAELVVGSPFIGKAVVTQQQLLATARAEVDIIKVAAQQPSTINRLIYDDEGGASRLLRSFLLISDADPVLLVGKTFNDILSVADLLELINLQLGRVLADSIQAQAPRPAFVLSRPLQDQTSIADPRQITVNKNLADAVGMIDDFSLGDGNVFDLGLFRSDQILMDQQLLLLAAFNRIFQEDTAQLDRTSLQFGFSATDIVQTLEDIFITRLVALSDDAPATDAPQLYYSKNLSDFFAVLSLAGVGDGNVFNFGLNVPAETLTIDQSHSKFLGKASNDSTDIVDFDQRIVEFYRVFEDITTMLDLIGVGDGSEFFLQLPQADAVDVLDPEFNLYWTALRSFEHGTELLDVQTLQAGKNLDNALEIADPKTLTINKNFSDAFTALSLAGIGDGLNFFFASFAADIVAATDPAFSLLFAATRTIEDTVESLDQSAREFGKAILDDSATAEQQRQIAVLKQLVSGAVPAMDASVLTVALNRQELTLAADTEPTRDIVKALLDSSTVDQQRKFTVLKTLDAEDQELTDFFARRFDAIRSERDGFADFTVLGSLAIAQTGKFNQEELFYNDVFARLFVANRNVEEETPTQDQIFKFETRTPFDDMQAADQRVVLVASKNIFDDATMLDLTGVGDGSNFRLSLDKIEIQPVNEYYARRVRFRRRARDGFLEEVTMLESFTILLPLVVGDPPGFDGVTIVQLDEQSAGRRDLRLFTNLGRFEDVPAEQLFYRQVEFYRYPWHNEAEAKAAGSDGFGNLQPMSDESPFGPAPAKYLQTFIPSPTKSDTTSVEVKAGGVSSTATNFVIFSERVGDSSYWNPGLRSGVNVVLNYANGPDGSVSSASQLSAVGTGVAESYIGYQVTSIANLASIVVGRTYYFSVWLRAETTSTPIRLAADLNAGTVNFGASNAAVTNLTTSWTRIELAFTSTVNNPRVFIGTTASSGNWGDQDAGGSGDNILAWGAQVSEFSSSTYVKTLADPFTGVSVAQRNQPGLEQTYWFVDLDAKAGASYSVRNKFIDWVIPANQKVRNSGLQNSSNLVSFLPRDRDSVGIIDSSLTYVYNAGRFGLDELLIGRQDGDPGYRLYGANAETTRFFFNKRGTLFDGGTSAAIVGLPFGFRVSDSDQERLSYFLTTRMRRGVTSTTSGVTDLFSTYLDPVYVGQRSPWQGAGVTVTSTLQTRRSGDTNENLSFLLAHPTSETTIANTSRFQLFPQIRLGGDEASRSSSIVTLGIPEYGFRVSDTLLEQTKFVLLQTIKQGVTQTIVGFGTSITTFAGARGSRVYVGDPTAFAATTSIQTRRSGSTLENTSYWFDKNARRGVAGSTRIKTIEIDPYPLLNALSSVLVSRTALDLDDIGVYDQMDIRYSGAQRIFDLVTIGTDAGFRVYDPGINPETVKFFFIKGLRDTVPMLDLTGIFDGLNSFITVFKTEQITFGQGTTNVAYPERRSGTDLERMSMRFELPAKQAVARTFSGNTVTAQDLERIYIGTQETFGFRVSGENLENVRFFVDKDADQDTPARVVLGIPDYGFRVSDTLLEQTRFNVAKLAKPSVTQTLVGFGTSITVLANERSERVFVGDPTAFAATTSIQTRRSGSTLENTSYWFDKNAKRGVAGSTTISTIDPTPDLLNFSNSSVSVVRSAADLDDVGALDSLNLFYLAQRIISLDSVLIGGDQLDGFGRFSNTTLERISYFFNKRGTLFDGGTSSVILGRGATSVTFPERRSGDSLDNPAFFVTIRMRRGATSTASGVTDLASTTLDPIYVGQRPFQGSDAGARLSGDRNERLDVFLDKVLLHETPQLDAQRLFAGLRLSRSPEEVTQVTLGRGTTNEAYPERRSGDSLDNPAFLVRLDAKQGQDTTFTGAFTSVTTRSRDRDRIFVGDPSLAPRRSGSTLENISYFYDKSAKFGRAGQTVTIQTLPGNNGIVSSVAVSQATSNTDLVGTLSNYTDVRTFIRSPHHNTFDDVAGAFDDSALPGDDSTNSPYPAKLLLKRAYLDDGSNGTSHAVKAGTDTVIFGNLIDNSEDFTSTRWVNFVTGASSGVVITTGVADPDSGTSATQLTATRANSALAQYTLGSTVGAVSGNLSTYSIWMRHPSTSVTLNIYVDLDGAGANPTVVTSLTVGSSWNQYQLNFTPTTSNPVVWIGGGSSFSTGETVIVWHPQVNYGRGPTPYVATTSEPILLTTQSRYSGDGIENISYFFDKTAKRSVAGTVQLNTIDPNPDVEFTVSSVLVSRTAADLDEVGTIDQFSLTYLLFRFFEDYPQAGSGIDQRQTTLERISFVITKLISGDGSEILDLVEAGDGNIVSFGLSKRDTQVMGSGQTSQAFPARTRDSLENISYFIDKNALQGNATSRTVSGVTTTAADTDRLFVGQQYGDIRLSGDPLERLFYRSETRLGNSRNDAVATETVPLDAERYFLAKRANPDGGEAGSSHLVIAGRERTNQTYPERRSGDQLDNPAFFFVLSAKRATSSGSITVKTIDSAGENRFSSTNITYGSLGPRSAATDAVGVWDYMFTTYDVRRTFEHAVLLGSGEDFRYSGLENIRFFVGKRLGPEYDLGSSNVILGHGLDQPRGNDLEFLSFNFRKFAKEFNGTTAVVILGRGTTSVAYPERRSNDQLDNPAFFVGKTAQIRGSIPVNQAWYSPVSAVTGLAHTAYRHTDTEDPVFVGTLGYKNSADILSDSSNTSIWVQQTIVGQYTSGSVYTLSGYFRRPAGNSTADIALDVGTTGFSITATSVTRSVSNDWQRLNVRFTAPRTSITIRIRSLATGGIDDLEVFGVQINSGTTVTSYVKTTTVINAANRLLHSEDLDNAAWAKSSNTVVYANVTEAPAEFWAGTDWARPGDSQEKLQYRFEKTADQDSSQLVAIGSGEDRRNAELEPVRFTLIGKRATLFDGGTSSVILGRGTTSVAYPERRSGDNLNNPAFTVNLTAYRGTTGNLTLNTIDPNPDVEFAQSSVTIAQGTRSIDAVGMLDTFNLFYAIGRIIEDTVTLGSDADFRYSPLERTNFFVGKRLGQDDGSEILDLTGIFDGLNYSSILIKREDQPAVDRSAFSPYPARFFSKDAKAGATRTVSSQTALATSTDRLFVGQQYGDIRLSRDPMERVSFDVTLLAEQSSSQTVQAGSGEDFRYNSLERTSFFVNKRGTLFDGGTSAAVMLDVSEFSPYPARFFSLDAKKGVSSLQTFKTIDAIPGVGTQSSTQVLITAATRDTVGIIDEYDSVFLDTGRRFFDTVLVGSGEDRRSADLERIRFPLITKRLGPEYSVGSSNVILGHGLDQARGNDLERISYFLARRVRLPNGTTSTVVLGRGTTSVAYPERRSNDTLENVTFRFEKLADQNSSQLVAAGSGQDRRSADLERIRFTLIGKLADQDSSQTVQAGSGEDRRTADLERIRFTFIGKRANLFDGGTSSVVLGRGVTSQTFPERRSGDSLDNPAFSFSLAAKKGVNSNQPFKLIDPLNGNSFQSSNQVLITSYSPDITGMIDYLELILFTGRVFLEEVLIGSGEDRREALLERISFFVRKRLGQDDGSEILDLTDIFDGLNYNAILNKRETLLIGNGSSASQTFPARAKSGVGEIVGFDFSKTAQIRGTVPVNQAWASQFSSVTGIAADASRHSDTLDPVYVGSLGYKNSADILSDSSQTSVWVQQTIVGQYTSGSVYTLSGYFRRPSGVSTDIALDVGTTGFSITATSVTRSVTGAWGRVNVQFIAPRTSITIRIRSLDTGGTDTLEIFGVQINSGNTVTSYVKTTTAIVAANRLLHSEDLENAAWTKSSNTVVYANIADAPAEFWAGIDWARPGDSQERLTYRLNKLADQDSSQLVQIGGDQIDGEIRYSGTTLERISYFVGKQATLDDGTMGRTDPVTIGTGTSAPIVYPARRSGEQLENTSFFFNKTAKQGSGTTTTVSGVTVTAASPDRIFVGQQTWQGFAAGARRSGDRNERISFDVLKDGIAEDREILQNFQAAWFARLNDGVGQMFHDTPATDFFVINNLKDHFDDAPTEDDIPTLDVVKALGLGSGAADLEGTDDINNVSTAGYLRNIGYADISYFAEDYVGDSRTLF